MNQPGPKASAATVLFFKIRTEFCKTRFERFKGIFLGRKTKTASTGEEAEVSKGSISFVTKMISSELQIGMVLQKDTRM